jgi:membrane protease subunit HflK
LEAGLFLPWKTLQPGLHLKFPSPIDKVVKVNTKKIRQLNLGNISGGDTFALLWTRPHGEEVHFLTGDNNFFNPYIVLHYRIKSMSDYIYQQREPDVLLENAGYHILTKAFSGKSFDEITISWREKLEVEIRNSLQEEMDELRSGIEIINVNIKDIHPPREIAGSFEEVIAAYQEKEELINQARGYRNRELPLARGNALKEVSNASAYVIDKIKKAEGESRRFLSQLSEFKKAKPITRKNLYFEAMRKSLQGNEKVLVDPKSGLPDLWLRFDGPVSLGDKEERK